MNNAKEILEKVEECIKELEDLNKDVYKFSPWLNKRYYEVRHNKFGFRISNVCNELSIFDWWNESLSTSQLKDMRKFLKEAIKLGYEGYVCFMVGASGCANGMWAHKEESTTGHSPDGDFLYKSFTPDYNYWSFSKDEEFNKIKTIRQLEEMIEEVK